MDIYELHFHSSDNGTEVLWKEQRLYLIFWSFPKRNNIKEISAVTTLIECFKQILVMEMRLGCYVENVAIFPYFRIFLFAGLTTVIESSNHWGQKGPLEIVEYAPCISLHSQGLCPCEFWISARMETP